MKKVLMIVMLAFPGITAQAQSNSLLVYGNLEINSSKSGAGVKTNKFAFSPAVGYQWNDHWTGGVNLRTETWKEGAPKVKTTSLGAGPFVRYAYPLSDIFAVYGQLNANYFSGKTAGVKSAGFESTLFPAIGVNLKNGFALNFTFGSLSFVSTKIKGQSDNDNAFGLNFGSGAGFGISKNFGL
jgi:hypothetical protein